MIDRNLFWIPEGRCKIGEPAFISTLAFWNGLKYHNSSFKMLNCNTSVHSAQIWWSLVHRLRGEKKYQTLHHIFTVGRCVKMINWHSFCSHPRDVLTCCGNQLILAFRRRRNWLLLRRRDLTERSHGEMDQFRWLRWDEMTNMYAALDACNWYCTSRTTVPIRTIMISNMP